MASGKENWSSSCSKAGLRFWFLSSPGTAPSYDSTWFMQKDTIAFLDSTACFSTKNGFSSSGILWETKVWAAAIISRKIWRKTCFHRKNSQGLKLVLRHGPFDWDVTTRKAFYIAKINFMNSWTHELHQLQNTTERFVRAMVMWLS